MVSKMKKDYLYPEISVVKFNSEEVITASAGSNDDGEIILPIVPAE